MAQCFDSQQVVGLPGFDSDEAVRTGKFFFCFYLVSSMCGGEGNMCQVCGSSNLCMFCVLHRWPGGCWAIRPVCSIPRTTGC